MARYLRIDPYVPDRVERLGDNTGQFSDKDIGKPVKYNGEAMVLCASGDPIVGFVTAVEPGTKDGYSIGAVRMDTNQEQYATDEAGTLSVGDIVSAGTEVDLGTANPANGPNVLVIADPSAVIHRWEVVSVHAVGAGSRVLLRKV